jgi:cysteine synthase A
VPDAFVHGVGTGGTLIGVGQAFREVNPNVRLFAMEPSESRTILCGEVALHQIEGISDGFVPGIFAHHRDLVKDTTSVASADAIAEMRKLARTRGLFCGPSSGAHIIAARRIRQQFPEIKTVVTILDDEGEKYLQDFFMHPAPGADKPVPFH